MLGECQVNVKSQSELDIGGRETCTTTTTTSMAFRQTSYTGLTQPEPYQQLDLDFQSEHISTWSLNLVLLLPIKDYIKLVRGTIRPSLRDGLSTPYQLTKLQC